MVAAQNKTKHVYSLLGTGTERNEHKKCHFFFHNQQYRRNCIFFFHDPHVDGKKMAQFAQTSSLSRVRTVVINLGKLRGLFPGLESLWKMSFVGQVVGKLGKFMILVNRDCAEGG